MPPYFRCPAISKDGEIASDKVCQRELVSLVSTTGKPRPTALYGRWCFSSTDERRRRENIGPHATAAPNFAAKTWEAPMLPAVAGRRAPHLKWDDRGARFRGQQIFLFWREYLVTVERTLSRMKTLLSAFVLALGIGFALPATNAYAYWCGPNRWCGPGPRVGAYVAPGVGFWWGRSWYPHRWHPGWNPAWRPDPRRNFCDWHRC